MTLAAGRQMGRFALRAELGRGAQATVWRAYDERLDREVAIKLFRPAVGAVPIGLWLSEARAVSRLAHPHIVPVFDADEIDGQPCLVFELVPGQTLTQRLRAQGALPAREAVELMLGVVDALRAAHEQGIVHRDLKPSNILLDAEGRAQVMDFGIAARWVDAGAAVIDELAGCIVGTPGYLSPEAAAGAPASPLMDVFAAGLVLGELLSGAPLLAERNPLLALQRVQTEDLLLSAAATSDDRLRAIVQRAIARKPEQRFESAAALRDAMMLWLAPTEEVASAQLPAGSGHGTLDFLLRRMRHKSDFPALSAQVMRIQRLASSDSERLNTLSDEILKDVALTQKLLRLVNSAYLRRDSAGVATVSRATALVGLAGIRNMALSLVLVEHMQDKAQAQRLKEEFLRSMLAGQLAQTLSSGSHEAEEVFLGAMFYNLGKLLTEYYFPEEADAIRKQLALMPANPTQHPDLRLDRAASMVLGLGFEALGVGVARHWGLPDSLQHCMRRPSGATPERRLPAGAERQRWLAVAANELSTALWLADEAGLPQRLESVIDQHGRALGLSLPDLRRAVELAGEAMAAMAPAMGLSMPKAVQARKQAPPALSASAAALDLADVLTAHQLTASSSRYGADVHAPSTAGADAAVNDATALLRSPSDAATQAATVVLSPQDGAVISLPDRSAVADLLAAGIQDITDTLSGDSFRLNEVLRMVLETMYRALGFQRMVFCLRDQRSGMLSGRFGLGDRAASLSPLFQVALRWPAGQAPDLFGAICLKGSDMLIKDSRTSAIAPRLPQWYRQQVNAPSFLLLPMLMKGAPFAMIYADHARSGVADMADRELALLRTLRNQAVMAFRQLSAAA